MTSPIPTITLSAAAPPPPDLTIHDDTIEPSQEDLHRQPKKRLWSFEQKLMDGITTIFGPHLVEIAMKQDILRLADRPSLSSPPSSSGKEEEEETVQSTPIPENDGSSSTVAACVATTLVPGLDPPRVNLSHANGVFPAIHLAWLQQLKIVYRCDAKCGGEGSKAYFLNAPAFNSLVPQSSEEDREEEAVVRAVDLSQCETLEALWIEDLDVNGQPQRLRSWRNLSPVMDTSVGDGDVYEGVAAGDVGGSRDLIPFEHDRGLCLPRRLRSLNLVGMSAHRFNFGWLRSTPKLESVNVHGMRIRLGATTATTAATGDTKAAWMTPRRLRLPPSLWNLEGVFLPQLRHLSIHHAPARHFRFNILKHCPQLVSLDIRDLHPDTIREALCPLFIEQEAGRGEDEGGEGEERDVLESLATKITICRFEILRVPAWVQSDSTWEQEPEPIAVPEMVKLLELYFPRLTQLHLDGIPTAQTIEITTGPPATRRRRAEQQAQQQPKESSASTYVPAAAALAAAAGAELPWLGCVSTREKVTAREVLECKLVSSVVKDQLGTRMHSVQYTIGTKDRRRR
ncbi:hypothetical protein BGX23_010889 [Mortierella sp. AD031]|nr:hypothetical protein BGX23_010889 [Mortierella sp. AD031]